MKERIQEIINASKGTKGHYTILTKAGEERKLRNGWKIKSKTSEVKERDSDFVLRLLEEGYSQIKLYYSTGKIRGLYDTFAMVKK